MQTHHPAGAELPVLSLGSKDPASLTDEELMSVLRNAVDDSLADDVFSELYRRYEARVRSWCARATGDSMTATDLSQEVFLKAYRYMHTFRGEAKFSTWLYSIAHNHCLNSLKRRATEPVEARDVMCERLPDRGALEPYAAIERNESYRLMWQLVSATLNNVEKRVVVLHYGHDWPLATITEKLALSNPSGAKAYIVSARRKLHGAVRRLKKAA